MKIAFVSSVLAYPWGGADALWTRTAEAAIQRGDSLWLGLSPLTARHPHIQQLQARGAQLELRTTHSFAPTKSAGIRIALHRFLGHPSFLTKLRRFSPDVLVLCQGGTFDFLVESQLVAWLIDSGLPYVVVCQANAEHTSVGAQHRDAAIRIFAAARNVVFVSHQNLRLAERQLGVDLTNAKVIQNPVAPLPGPLPWPSEKLWRFAAVGRLESADKGYDVLLPALAAALGSEPAWTLEFFGQGSDAQYLERLGQKYGVADRVAFRGFSTDIASVWRERHLLLLPSRIEGCSLAMMEALCLGRPVLATDVGGVSDWIEDGVTGFVCAAAQQACLEKTLRYAWLQRTRWQQMGVLAGERAARLLDPAPELTLLQLISRADMLRRHRIA